MKANFKSVKELRNIIISEMEDKIKKVLDEEVDAVNLYYVRPNDIIKCVENIGGKADDCLETNGWQWDYWLKFNYNDKSFLLSGDGYYESSCTFSIKK